MGDYRKYFDSAIRHHYPATARIILQQVEGHYFNIRPDVAFAAHSANPIDRRLDVSAYFLALMKTLHEQGESFETIKKVCIGIAADYVRPKNQFQKFLKKLPVKLLGTWAGTQILKAFEKRVSSRENPEGFVARIITDKDETYGLGYGVDILECGICKLYKKHNYEKFVPILCEVDKITTAQAGLVMIRNGTIALGAEKCDFRYRKQLGL
jgi:hypothetical protein